MITLHNGKVSYHSLPVLEQNLKGLQHHTKGSITRSIVSKTFSSDRMDHFMSPWKHYMDTMQTDGSNSLNNA